MNAGVCLDGIQGYSDCESGSVTRKIRDFVVTAIALIVLFAMLLSINPDLRERVTRMVTDGQVSGVPSTISYMAESGFAVAKGYAGDNTYLFTFLVAACVFFVLMLKVIS